MKFNPHFLPLPALLLAVAACAFAPVAPAPPPGRYVAGAGLDADALGRAAAPFFDPAQKLGETRALLILHEGRIIAERYAPGFGPDTRLPSWSIAKTVTALLVGIMVSDGRLALDAPAPVAAWRQPGDPRGRITVRQLLNMTSGIAHREQEGPLEDTDALRMLVGDGAQDQAAYAEAKPLAAEPGDRFRYSSASSLILADMMTGLLTESTRPEDRRAAMAAFLRERLSAPAGLASLSAEFDARGTMIGGAMMHMTARDYARLGELLRNHGRLADRQIVPARWIRVMTSPSPVNAGYGGHLWLNRPGAESTLFPGSASPRLFAANGFRGQYVLVDPGKAITVVRLGVSTDAELPRLRDALAQLVERLSAGHRK